ncbi:hypothetical protein CBS101457_004027 [Exobasidium rhododendri]|nr:hypothetical protein CBS101457_004027 [Exobasidium rhododendri]
MLAIPLTGFTLGFGAGLYGGAKRSSLVFMAENAHRRPDTVQGWFFYNKTKNYRVLLAGITSGLKTGARVGFWTLAYVGIEYGITRLQQDRARRQGGEAADIGARWIASGTAGLGIAGGASLLCELCIGEDDVGCQDVRFN